MTNNNNFNIFDLEEQVDMLSDIKNEIEKIWEPQSDNGELFELRDSITKFKDMIKPEVHEIEQLSLSSSNSEDRYTNKESLSLSNSSNKTNVGKKEIINIKFINEEFEDFKKDSVIELDEECENESFEDIITKLDRLNHDNNFNPDLDMNLEEELEKSGYIEPTMLEPVIENDVINIEMKDMTADTIDLEEDIILDDYYFTGGVMDYVYKNKMYVATVIGGATVGGLLFGGVGIFFGAIPAVISGSAGTAVGGVVGNKVAVSK